MGRGCMHIRLVRLKARKGRFLQIQAPPNIYKHGHVQIFANIVAETNRSSQLNSFLGEIWVGKTIWRSARLISMFSDQIIRLQSVQGQSLEHGAGFMRSNHHNLTLIKLCWGEQVVTMTNLIKQRWWKISSPLEKSYLRRSVRTLERSSSTADSGGEEVCSGWREKLSSGFVKVPPCAHLFNLVTSTATEEYIFWCLRI